MSHFIGLVFSKDIDVETMLEPYNEQLENEEYLEFEDCTEKVEERFKSLPEKDESVDSDGNPTRYPCDKEHYPTIEALASDWFGYGKNSEGRYGYTHNPNAKWDWYADGGRWAGYIYGKDDGEHNSLPFNEIDWEKMFKKIEHTYTDYKGEETTYIDNHIPFCIVDTDGNWHEKGEMGWFAIVSNEKDEDVWSNEVMDYVKHLEELPEDEKEGIVVYAIDFHI